MKLFFFSATKIKWLIRLWPPLWFTGIRFDYIAQDFRHIRVSMPLRFYNKNLDGLQFGGSLYMMTDPCYLMMIARNLGDEYRVLDKAASIDYIKPGTSTVFADFVLAQDDVDDIIQNTAGGDKYFKDFTINIKNKQNELIATVIKTLYIRKKLQNG